MKVAVFGSHGFVGSAVAAHLRSSGHEVSAASSPRLECDSAEDALDLPKDQDLVDELAAQVGDSQVVINCAGDPDASSQDTPTLLGANAALPGLIAAAANHAHASRMVHVSTAAVQGRAKTLDSSTDVAPFSPYSWSKAVGESACAKWGGTRYVIYRPPSVHAPGRRVTETLIRLAGSPLRSVAGHGSAPTPQALLENVSSAICYLGVVPSQPPQIVAHPWEGLTTAMLMRTLGEKEPHHIPTPLAHLALRGLMSAGKLNGRIAADARRIEMCWFGQEQATSWLSQNGWTPPLALDSWSLLSN